MAKVFLHSSIAGISGRLGGLVFRQCNGRTFVACAPRPSHYPPTPAQLAQRERFAAAARARSTERATER